jgi:putative membrane protein
MVFIDNLAIELFSVAFAGFLVLYMTVKMYLAYRRGEKNLENHLRSGIIPMAILGVFILIMGIYGEIAWPLPGSYNILFYDPYIILGVLILGTTVSIMLKEKMQNIGFLGLMGGLVIIYYGIQGYMAGLTEIPLALLGLFGFAGLAGILFYPVTLLVDRTPIHKNRISAPWFTLLVLFCVFIALTAGLAAFIGALALPAHLMTTP